jgi:hypothetical protein
MKNAHEEIFTFNNAGGLYRDSISRKLNGGGGGLLAKDETVYKLDFLVIFKQMLLSAYMENTQTAKN